MNCFSSGAIVRTGGSQPCSGGAPSAKYSISKDKKIILEQIEDMLTEISRKGRAAGVHMIVSTQRPDAVVLPSAIKSNFTYRIAGECDDNLSRIILDNGNANSMIPKDTKGVFLDSNGRLFKGFLLVE